MESNYGQISDLAGCPHQECEGWPLLLCSLYLSFTDREPFPFLMSSVGQTSMTLSTLIQTRRSTNVISNKQDEGRTKYVAWIVERSFMMCRARNTNRSAQKKIQKIKSERLRLRFRSGEERHSGTFSDKWVRFISIGWSNLTIASVSRNVAQPMEVSDCSAIPLRASCGAPPTVTPCAAESDCSCSSPAIRIPMLTCPNVIATVFREEIWPLCRRGFSFANFPTGVNWNSTYPGCTYFRQNIYLPARREFKFKLCLYLPRK